MAKATQRQIVASLVPTTVGVASVAPQINGGGGEAGTYFTTVSGGEISAAVEKIYDGGNIHPEVLCAPSEIGDITVSRYATDDTDDHNLLQNVRQLVGRAYYDITVFTLNCDLAVPGSERVYPKALLVGLTEPDGDASSGAPATYSLTFSISSVDDSQETSNE